VYIYLRHIHSTDGTIARWFVYIYLRHIHSTDGTIARWFVSIYLRHIASTVIYPNLLEGADHVAGQLHGDKEYPFSGVTKSGRVWRRVPKSNAQSGTHTHNLLTHLPQPPPPHIHTHVGTELTPMAIKYSKEAGILITR